MHKLARKQDDAGVVIQDPNAAAAAALKGLQDAAVGGGAAAASVPRDSATTWGLDPFCVLQMDGVEVVLICNVGNCSFT